MRTSKQKDPLDVASDVAEIIKERREVKKTRINLRDRLVYTVEESKQDPKLYRRWRNMFQRCYGKHPMAKYYVNVHICKEWHTYAKFALWCYTQPDYSPDKDLDRYPDPYGDYKPSNSRFINHKQNMRSQRLNLYVEWEGSEYLLCELCEILEVDYNRTWHRIYKYGWTVEDAILKPCQR